MIDEIPVLNDYQLDALIKEQFPELPSSRDWTRRQTSHSGIVMDMNRVIVTAEDVEAEDESCHVAERVYALGGVRLLTLYCNGFNLSSAAIDLGIKYGTLVKWFQRWRKKALQDGLKPEDFGIVAKSCV